MGGIVRNLERAANRGDYRHMIAHELGAIDMDLLRADIEALGRDHFHTSVTASLVDRMLIGLWDIAQKHHPDLIAAIRPSPIQSDRLEVWVGWPQRAPAWVQHHRKRIA